MGFDAEVTEDDSNEVETQWEPAQYEQGTPIETGGERDGEGIYIPLRKKADGDWQEKPNTKKVHALKIKTADYVGGGNVSGAKGGTGRKSGGTGGKGSGSGGSKPAKAPKKKDLVVKKEKDKKRLEDEEERYHEINKELERTSHLLNMIGKEKDRAFGRNKIKNLNSENDLLKKQVSQYRELKKQAEAYRKTDALNLAKYGA
jgi:hypothetical protein